MRVPVETPRAPIDFKLIAIFQWTIGFFIPRSLFFYTHVLESLGDRSRSMMTHSRRSKDYFVRCVSTKLMRNDHRAPETLVDR
jgi:hypothetical protein